jgi:heme o synthase
MSEAAIPLASSPASTWRDYLALLKPRVMSLVVFTAVTGLVAAGAPVHPFTAAVAVLCIAVGAGAAGALNMAFDADIDAVMRRTRSRPVAAGRVRAAEAYGFGVALSLFAVLLMYLATNLLAAGLLAFTIVFYGLVYTVWLKRSTPQNIVIGGAAGALPPVIGWAAASGEAPLQAWLLFALIFLWTPPHFWALSLYASEDYARAKVPMLPVVHGAKATRLQILLYSLVLVPVGVAPALIGLGGPAYAAVSLGGGAMFLLLAWRVFRSRAGETDAQGEGLYDPKLEARPARDLFAFSILYLFALFAALLAEQVWRLWA